MAGPGHARRPGAGPPHAGSSTRSRSACRSRCGPTSTRSRGCARRRARSSGSRWTSSTARSPTGRVEDLDGTPGVLAGVRPRPRPRPRGEASSSTSLGAAVGLVLLSPDPRRHRGRDRARHRPPGAVPPAAHRPPRPPVRGRQVPVDGRRRRGRARPSSPTRNALNGPVFKIDDDPRVTRVGRFLRRTSPRRAAAAVERPAGPDEPRRAAPAAARARSRATTCGTAAGCR